jgi:nucleotide-binding universal stress UspA family protein
MILNFHKIVWAVDPFEEPGRLQAPLKALKYLVEVTNSLVQPVYVLATEKPSESEGDVSDRTEGNLFLNRKVIDSLFKNIYQKNLLPPQVIQANSVYASQITDKLIVYAKNLDADVIVAYTHGESGLNRILRGSFVERLLLRSSIPVVTLGPELKEIQNFNRILYATHLNSLSTQVFRRAVGIAQSFHSELTVLHLLSRRERDADSHHSAGVGQDLPPRSHLIRRSRAWTNWAARKGIMTEIDIEDATMQVSQQVLQVANRLKVGLIVLESHSGQLASFLKRSKIREVVRYAHCPVWVQRTLSNKFASQSDWSRNVA